MKLFIFRNRFKQMKVTHQDGLAEGEDSFASPADHPTTEVDFDETANDSTLQTSTLWNPVEAFCTHRVHPVDWTTTHGKNFQC